MSDTDTILQALKDHRAETRQDMHELRGAVVKIADAASEMGKTMARSEERHQQHDDANKRITQALDDHEARIRIVESDHPTIEKCQKHSEDIDTIKNQMLTGRSSVSAGWKVLTAIGGSIVGMAVIVGVVVKVAQ